MKIVLLERVEKLGKMGDVVSVANGYARNFLLPKKKALRATSESLAYFEKERARLEAASKDLEVKAQALAQKIGPLKLLLVRQSSESGMLYGSITSRDISKELLNEDIAVAHGQVILAGPLKASGIHRVTLRLHPEVTHEITVSVAPSLEEAKAQLEKPIDKAQDAFKEKKASKKTIEPQHSDSDFKSDSTEASEESA